MKKTFTILCLLFIFGCKKEQSDLDQVTNVRGGRCLLAKNTSDFICINFNSDYDPNTASTTCQNEYQRYKSSHNVSGISWLSGNANTCSNGSSATSVGNCSLTHGIIYYYDNHWNASSAQSDCTSIQSGTWNP